MTNLQIAHRRAKEGRCPVCGSPYTTPAVLSTLGSAGIRCCECGYDSLNPEHAFMIPGPYQGTFDDHYFRVFPRG